jgi:hypothetical protein
MTELLPCPNPVCDMATPQLVSTTHNSYPHSYVECLVCQMRGPAGMDADIAAECWNRLPRGAAKVPAPAGGFDFDARR